MADYSELQEQDIESLLAGFGVPTVARWSALEGGRANSSYLVEAGPERFVLTVCDEKTLQEIERSVELLQLLERHALPTPRVVGEIQEYHGRPVVLKRFVDGQVERLELARLPSVGKALAQLHALPAPDFLPREFSYGVGFFYQVIEWPGSGEFGRWLSRIRGKVLALPWDDLPWGLIHGDLFWDNIVLQGNQVTLLDFEEACYYPLVFDLGMTIVGTCYRSGQDWKPRVEALLDGYGPLAEIERNVLADFAVYAAAATACWRFWQYNINVPGTDQTESYREMVEAADALEAGVL